jgi:hypothetical protein
MSSLIKAEGPQGIIDILREDVPLFFRSPEYEKLDYEDAGVTGLVCAAFAEYWCRLADTGQLEGSDEFVQCVHVVEALSSSDNRIIQNYVVTEILESLDAGKIAAGTMQRHMGKKTRALFRQWLR